ncbi:unnamed protein product (macronuclear) [Paramecium tetraurelia]|uniref:Uncharacterized protein n=1 Tax=Paramecium tetraurelia TaxID=5888 RepID=A0D184_PARTE|nr:uncharacterized protein GSPATT00012325001 [Paramecium tetraurelia]CAK76801.1 unnamed protein product [Paramecium tetraurelia]|eukprot:XP_001444198.1 hypothetical protein (macronuclear) [Paramecium tetraurelia strain d4-2]
MIKHYLTQSSSTKHNFSQKLQLQKLKRNKLMVSKAIDMLQNPFDPSQVSQSLKFLENQTQRKALLDQIIGIREERKRKQEFEKMSSMRGILIKVQKRFTVVKNQDIKFNRDFNDFKIVQEERNKMEKLQYENLNLQINERKTQFKRMSSLNFLTRESDNHILKHQLSLDPGAPQSSLVLTRKTQRNTTLLQSKIANKQIPTECNTEKVLTSPQNCLIITQETDQE